MHRPFRQEDETHAAHTASTGAPVGVWIVQGRPAMRAWAAWMRVQQGLPLTDWPEELPYPRQPLAKPLPTLRQRLRARGHALAALVRRCLRHR